MTKSFLRRDLLFVAAGALVVGLSGCDTTTALGPQLPPDTGPDPARPLTLIYIGARNCPYCREWERASETKFLASAERQKLTYRRLMFGNFRNLQSDSVWPDDLQWVRDSLGIRSGTPRFVLLRGRDVLVSFWGTGDWGRVMLPRIRLETA